MSEKFKRPRVYMVGAPATIPSELCRFFADTGVPGWKSNAPSDGELLCEVMGRLCYRSFEVGLNKNVTRIREGNDTYLANINRSGHGAVLEHAMVNFILTNVSRVFTHELCRHRVGVAISQESMRYVRIDDINHYESILMDDVTKQWFIDHAKYTEDLIAKLEGYYKVDELPFEDKKKLTSMFRRIAPDGILTKIGWSANFRTLRHIIPLRTSVHAEEEIRAVFHIIALECKSRFPNVFADLYVNASNEWGLSQ